MESRGDFEDIKDVKRGAEYGACGSKSDLFASPHEWVVVVAVLLLLF